MWSSRLDAAQIKAPPNPRVHLSFIIYNLSSPPPPLTLAFPPPVPGAIFPKMFSLRTPLLIAGREFHSRLLIGTGKFSSPELMRDALDASGAQIVTVALRRADLSGQGDPFANILDFVDPKRYLLLPEH